MLFVRLSCRSEFNCDVIKTLRIHPQILTNFQSKCIIVAIYNYVCLFEFQICVRPLTAYFLIGVHVLSFVTLVILLFSSFLF